MKLWDGILVYLQTDGDKIHPNSIELIGKGRELAEERGSSLVGVLVTNDCQPKIDFLQGYPLDKVYLYENKHYENFIPHIFSQPLENCINKIKPSVFLLGATIEGRSLAPRVAIGQRTGLTADCTELYLNDQGELIQIRPAFGGDLMAEIRTPTTRPQMATVRRGIADLPEKRKGKTFEIEKVELLLKQTGLIEVLEKIVDQGENQELEDAPLILAVGRGVKAQADLELFERLAERIGAVFAYTRGIVERGWRTPCNQIGLSGKAVSPKLLITLGVSGSVQFCAGIKNAEKIVAVNTDENAPIFRHAAKGIITDIYELAGEILRNHK